MFHERVHDAQGADTAPMLNTVKPHHQKLSSKSKYTGSIRRRRLDHHA